MESAIMPMRVALNTAFPRVVFFPARSTPRINPTAWADWAKKSTTP